MKICTCGSEETVLRGYKDRPHDKRVRRCCAGCGSFLGWAERTPGAVERMQTEWGQLDLERCIEIHKQQDEEAAKKRQERAAKRAEKQAKKAEKEQSRVVPPIADCCLTCLRTDTKREFGRCAGEDAKTCKKQCNLHSTPARSIELLDVNTPDRTATCEKKPSEPRAFSESVWADLPEETEEVD